ncbi:O-antigen ligase family protein [Tardiphaga sp. vice154]|nr:O-antigen ligase family protein [Tardiphaga sp. vice154]
MPNHRGGPRSSANPESVPLHTACVRWSGWLVLGAVALAPLPLGSVSAPAMAIWAVVLGVALLGLLTLRPRRGSLIVLALACTLALACLVVLYAQLAVAPSLSVVPDPIWAQASRLLGEHLSPSVAIARNQAFYAMGLGINSFLAFTTALLLAADRRAARQLLTVVAWSGAIYAVAAIASHLADPGKIFFVYEKQAHRESLTSPFLNRNTAALYYGCCALVWLMRACERIQHKLPSGRLRWRRLRASFDTRSSRPILTATAGWLICLIAMFLTGSRAGAGAALISMIIAVAAFFHRRITGRFGFAGFLMAASVAALGLLQLFGGLVGGRFNAQGLSDEGRLSTYRATVGIIRDHPWLGTGFGSFEMSYPAYRGNDISLAGIWNRAHNSLLELASSGGLPLAGLITVAGFAAFTVLLYGIRMRRRNVIFPVIAFAGVIAAVIHSMVDFSLQIPGYAIVIYSLFGAGLCQSFRSGEVPQGAAVPERVSSALNLKV